MAAACSCTTLRVEQHVCCKRIWWKCECSTYAQRVTQMILAHASGAFSRHAQALATAKAYATWLAQLGSSNGGQAKVMVSALLEATLPLISPGVSFVLLVLSCMVA